MRAQVAVQRAIGTGRPNGQEAQNGATNEQ